MTRIVILGGPRTGKTTLAQKLAAEHLSRQHRGHHAGYLRMTDDLIHLGWSEASQAAAMWFDEPGPWIIEGVAVVRALRKWRDAHPGEPPPVDRAIALWCWHIEPTPGQRAMARADFKRWREDVALWLIEHGVKIETLPCTICVDPARCAAEHGVSIEGHW